VTEYSRGITASEEPYDLAAGPDGAMWFTESQNSNSYYRAAKIGRISMSGTIKERSKNLDPQSFPTDVAAGPDGRMWFVETLADKMGRITI
jgi:virginiamycin B lyase